MERKENNYCEQREGFFFSVYVRRVSFRKFQMEYACYSMSYHYVQRRLMKEVSESKMLCSFGIYSAKRMTHTKTL